MKYSNSSFSGLLKIKVPRGYLAGELVGNIYQYLSDHCIRALYCAIDNNELIGRLFFLTGSQVSIDKLAKNFSSQKFEIEFFQPMKKELKKEFFKMIQADNYIGHMPGIEMLIGPTYLRAISELKEEAEDLEDFFWRKKTNAQCAIEKIEDLCMGYPIRTGMEKKETDQDMHDIDDWKKLKSPKKRRAPMKDLLTIRIPTGDLIFKPNPKPLPVNTPFPSLILKRIPSNSPVPTPVPSPLPLFDQVASNVPSHVFTPIPSQLSNPVPSQSSTPDSIHSSTPVPIHFPNLVPSFSQSSRLSPLVFENLVEFRFRPQPEVNLSPPDNFYQEYDPRNSSTPLIPGRPHPKPSPVEAHPTPPPQQNPEIKFTMGKVKIPDQRYSRYSITRSKNNPK